MQYNKYVHAKLIKTDVVFPFIVPFITLFVELFMLVIIQH